MMALFAFFVAFPLLGRNYDAAVLCAGICGFGLGATPNAMANMSAVCYKFFLNQEPFYRKRPASLRLPDAPLVFFID